jgi:hemolysin activation/secretion protein
MSSRLFRSFRLLLPLLAIGFNLRAADTPAAPTPTLQWLLIGASEEKAQHMAIGAGDANVLIEGVPLLDKADLVQSIAPFFGKPITQELVNELGKVIIAYVKKHDRVVVSVVVPDQNLAKGELRLAVTLGRYKQLLFKGNRWFSSAMLSDKLGIKAGDEVRLSTLEEAVNWANTNPFRRVRVVIDDLAATEPGKADLIVSVQEQLPLQIVAAYDNTGTDYLGNNHYSLSAQYGNLWGLDHQITYQFTTTDRMSNFESHSLDYRVPLPWRHYLQATAAYVKVEPVIGNGDFTQKGTSLIADLRYLAPYETKNYTWEFSGGLDFKQSNNNLEFGGFQLYNTQIDVAQFTLGTTMVRRDKWGAWVVAVNLNLSPGGMTNRNNDATFQEVRYGSKARYVQGSVQLQRVTQLPLGCQIISTAVLQRASTNLQSSEQMTIGGAGTVRGYPNRIFAGDEGVVITNELQGPTWTQHFTKKPTAATLQLRPVVFIDYAHVGYKDRIPSDIPLDPLSSAGVGLRCVAANHLSVSADFGWQISRIWVSQKEHAMGSLRATLSF